MVKARTVILLAVWVVIAAAPCRAQDNTGLFEALSRAYAKAAATIAPAVVRIEVKRGPEPARPGRPSQVRGMSLPTKVLDRFVENRRYRHRPAGGTSGVIISPEGHILTCWYNVSGKVESVAVVLADGRRFPARILGRDEDRDISLLKIEADNLPAATMRKDLTVRPGQFCVAVGRGMEASSYTLTTGIVSARHRYRDKAFQISARVNYGNAGGAVADIKGRLLGIVTHVSHLPPGNRIGLNTGVGLATPMARVADVLDRLKKGEVILRFRGPFLGIRFDQTYRDRDKGVKIEYVYQTLPSAKAGLKSGDIIIMFNNIEIRNRMDLVFAIQQCDVNQRVGFTVIRIVDGVEKTLDLWAVLTLRPSEEALTKLSAEYDAWKKAQNK
jgi:serine protease Do